ncbi:hypothetical protein F4802DRAFT_553743 [Xylaria palmicola]|nr:hypothetical protein F4802DRAFT_553743 [Xylaria palmicola]
MMHRRQRPGSTHESMSCGPVCGASYLSTAVVACFCRGREKILCPLVPATTSNGDYFGGDSHAYPTYRPGEPRSIIFVFLEGPALEKRQSRAPIKRAGWVGFGTLSDVTSVLLYVNILVRMWFQKCPPQGKNGVYCATSCRTEIPFRRIHPVVELLMCFSPDRGEFAHQMMELELKAIDGSSQL